MRNRQSPPQRPNVGYPIDLKKNGEWFLALNRSSLMGSRWFVGYIIYKFLVPNSEQFMSVLPWMPASDALEYLETLRSLTNMAWKLRLIHHLGSMFLGFNPHFSGFQHFSALFYFNGYFHLVWAPLLAHSVPTYPNAFVASSDGRPDRCAYLLQPASCGGRAVVGAQLTNALAGPSCGWELFWCAESAQWRKTHTMILYEKYSILLFQTS